MEQEPDCLTILQTLLLPMKITNFKSRFGKCFPVICFETIEKKYWKGGLIYNPYGGSNHARPYINPVGFL